MAGFAAAGSLTIEKCKAAFNCAKDRLFRAEPRDILPSTVSLWIFPTGSGDPNRADGVESGKN